MTLPEAHPVEGLADEIAEALRAADSPAREYAHRVYALEDLSLLPEEAQAPFYGVRIAASSPLVETADHIRQAWTVEVWAFQDLRAPTMGGAQTGLKPGSPAARAGVLRLVWAAFRTLRGRGFGAWGILKYAGETETQAVIVGGEGEKRLAGWVRRGLRFVYKHACDFEPEE